MLEGPRGPAHARSVSATLRFAQGGGRTFLQRQHVPYPFHITRPHTLSADRPDLATLILQSASGGLYRGDRLVIEITAAQGAKANLRSQAATVVHAASGDATVLEMRLQAAPGATLVTTTDPYILFPDAKLSVRTDVVLAPGALVIVAEGFAMHDPRGEHRTFGHLSVQSRVLRPDGRLLIDEASVIDGPDWCAEGSPLGEFRAMGSVLVLGEAAERLDPGRVETTLDALAVLSGVTSLPNGTGVGIRLLAAEGGRLARGLDAAVDAVMTAILGRAAIWRRR